MPTRTPRKQSEHDTKVRQIARRLRREGWDVDADIPGFDQPDPIGQDDRIPDIHARKAGAERIYEVETPETMEADHDQHSTFRRSAGQKRRTNFEVEVT